MQALPLPLLFVNPTQRSCFRMGPVQPSSSHGLSPLQCTLAFYPQHSVPALPRSILCVLSLSAASATACSFLPACSILLCSCCPPQISTAVFRVQPQPGMEKVAELPAIENALLTRKLSIPLSLHQCTLGASAMRRDLNCTSCRHARTHLSTLHQRKMALKMTSSSTTTMATSSSMTHSAMPLCFCLRSAFSSCRTPSSTFIAVCSML